MGLSKIENRCLELGLKMTDQRRVISKILSESDDHPNVEALYQRATQVDPKISMATVYRTVRLFEEAKILDKHYFGDGGARYETSEDDHYHLIDVQNDQVLEFVSDEIAHLLEKIASDHGYELVGSRLELHGMKKKK